MLTTAGIITLSLAKSSTMLMFSGACLAMGFWAGRKVTDKIDRVLFMMDKKKVNQLILEAQQRQPA
jgi:hypothetical protein